MPAVIASCLCALLVVLSARSSVAADWPQWRGPNRDGVWNETGILERFSADGLTFRWRMPAGFGWSSPVVARGRAFLFDSEIVLPTARERIWCFDEQTGNLLWRAAYEVTYPDWAFTAGYEAGPSATPIVENDRVYTVGGNGRVQALNVVDGSVIWDRDLGKDYMIEVLKCRASPLTEGKLLIVAVGGRPGACVVALDKSTGAEVWHSLDEPVSNSSPIVITSGGMRQLVIWTEQSVAALDPATGAVLWRLALVTSNNDAIATPVFDQNRLLVSGLMLQLDDQRPAFSVLWPARLAVAERLLSNTSSPLLRGEHVFAARLSGELVCLDAAAGKTVWENNTVTEINRGASINLTPNGDAMFLYTDRGELIRAQVTPAGFKELARTKLIEPVYSYGGRKLTWSPPAFANRHILVRNEKELVRASLEAAASDGSR